MRRRHELAAAQRNKVKGLAKVKKAAQKLIDDKAKEEEMVQIKDKLDALGIKYVHNTGLKKLRKLLKEAEEED